MATKLHALKSVGNFDGSPGSDVERWIDRMEMALRIEDIEENRHAVVFSFHLEGAAFDTWKGMSADGQADANAIKVALRTVFGLQRMEAWNLAANTGLIAPGETVDVAYENIKKLVNIAATGNDPIGRVASCILTARLPLHVQEQVLLQCGKDMVPAAVVACAKQLMSANSSTARGFSAVAKVRKNRVQQNWANPDRSEIQCFQCKQLGHYKRDCPSNTPAVSGNGRTGQPRM
jgi:hypothetical protein